MIQTTTVHEADAPFLFQVYASTRQAELAAWGWDAASRDAFLHMQWHAQTLSYAAQYPDADHRIIVVDNQPAGRIQVYRTPEALLLVDIALLPPFQGRGIGTELIRELQAEAMATGKCVRLQVLNASPARHLYERLGFAAVEDSGMYERMEWRATP